MDDGYLPASDFLRSVLADEVPLNDSDFGRANFAKLIEMTRDPDPSNRDWATLFVAQQDEFTDDIREALVLAAEDDDPRVAAEAMLGLANHDQAIALPLVKRALQADRVMRNIFEAAVVIAHPSLADGLRPFALESDDKYLDELVFEALAACENHGPSENG